MTDEHAMKVWREACGAYEDNSHDLTLSIRERIIAGDQAAAAIIAADRAELVERVKVLEGDKAALVKHSIKTLERWQLYGEACGILSGWLALTDDPEHLALLRKNTEAFLARAALKDTNHDA